LRPEGRRPPLDDPDLGTMVMSLQGQRQPGWARAHHQQAALIGHRIP
jgi:hypothetical protein